MTYIILNRNNVVLDILQSPRYIFHQPKTNLVIGCPKEWGTGLIGSDSNTHYILESYDISNNPNAVHILELETVPEDLVPNQTQYDEETQSFIPYISLQDATNEIILDQEIRLSMLEINA